MNFSSISGHIAIKNRLCTLVSSGRIPHAQLVAGDSTTMALPLAIAYARYILCPNRTDSNPCESCPTCYRTSKMEHPDLHFVFPVSKSKKAAATGRSEEKPISDNFIGLWREFVASNGGVFAENEWYEFIGVENQQGKIYKEEANEIIRKLSFKSFEGGYKIVVMYLPERMGAEAANTLLKLVEEPPASTLFLFVSETPDRVITTIRSRVQTIALAPIVLSGTLGGARGEEFFELFGGLMRRAYKGEYLELFDWVEEIYPLGREGYKSFIEYSISLLRECYVVGLGAEALSSLEGKEATFAANFSPYVNHLTVEALVAEFELALRQLRQNGSARIIFTHFALMVSKIIVSAKGRIAAGQ
ncbi:MAG: DNA polymerase III subunit delta [Rikenellaceae bacterium]